MDKDLKEIGRTMYEQIGNVNEETEILRRNQIEMPKNTKVGIKN